jgi:hypothetical protein
MSTLHRCALLLAIAFALISPTRSAAPDRLPDLGMARLAGPRIDRVGGQRVLRFDAIVVNVGDGAFELRGARPNTATALMSVQQRIFAADGAHRDVPSPAVLYYGGDGHDHWHVRDLQLYQLFDLDSGAPLGVGAKGGFCFFDNVDINRLDPRPPRYLRETLPPVCGRTGQELEVTMGLSVGWGDLYAAWLPDQYIPLGEVTGPVRLHATVDPDGWFAERDRSNNVTWIDLDLTENSVTILGYGPSAEPPIFRSRLPLVAR